MHFNYLSRDGVVVLAEVADCSYVKKVVTCSLSPVTLSSWLLVVSGVS